MTKDPKKIQAQHEREAKRKRDRRKNDPAWAKAQDLARIARAHRGAAHVPPGQQISKLSLLTNEQTGELEASWTKTEKESGPPVTPPPTFLLDKVTIGTFAGEQRVQWQSYSPEKRQQYEAVVRAMKEAIADYRGLEDPSPAPADAPANLCNVIAVGDPHVGMYAWAKETGQPFDCDIARDQLLQAATNLLARAPAADTCFIVELGDMFHAEDDTLRTPRGNNPLDGDSRSGRVTKIVYLLMRKLIELALKKHRRVIVVCLRGNHDPYKSIGLSLYLDGIYEREPRVEILDNNNPFVFWEFGKNLLGFHHGDGAKPEQLPGIMTTWKQGVPWGRCPRRRWFTGHVHSFNGKDFPGVVWESFRTLAPADYWAHWKGYRSEQSIDCLTFDLEGGYRGRVQETILDMEAV